MTNLEKYKDEIMTLMTLRKGLWRGSWDIRRNKNEKMRRKIF